MSISDVKVSGLDEAIEGLNALPGATARRAEEVFNRRLPAIAEDARAHCPVGKTGELRKSIRYEEARTKGLETRGSVAAGTDKAWYVFPVHERLDVKHPNGEAKFLENAVTRGQGPTEEDLQDIPGKAAADVRL